MGETPTARRWSHFGRLPFPDVTVSGATRSAASRRRTAYAFLARLIASTSLFDRDSSTKPELVRHFELVREVFRADFALDVVQARLESGATISLMRSLAACLSALARPA